MSNQCETPVELSKEILKYLTSPMQVTFSGGAFKSMKVKGNLPEWAVNVKKALASQFVVDVMGTNRIRSGSPAAGSSYTTMEQTVLGECETQYFVNTTGPFNNQQENNAYNSAENESNSQAFESNEGSQSQEHYYQGKFHSGGDPFFEENSEVMFLENCTH